MKLQVFLSNTNNFQTDFFMNRDIVISEFKFQLWNYVHFRANNLGKPWTPFTPPPMMGLNSITADVQHVKLSTKVDILKKETKPN